MVWGCACGLDIIVRSLLRFQYCELNVFLPSIYWQWVPREHNSSYNFYTNLFLPSLKLCMCFRCNPCINFCHFFLLWELLSFSDLIYIDSGYFVIATPHTILYRHFWNFAQVFSRVCRSACGLDIIYFCHFCHFNCHFLTSDFMKVYRLWVPFERNFSCIIWECECVFNEIPILISFTWNKHYFFVGEGQWGVGLSRCDINFTKVWPFLIIFPSNSSSLTLFSP